MIANNCDLRPTTAIKKLGITDPSIIRRLRDKYKVQQSCANKSPPPEAQTDIATQSPVLDAYQIPASKSELNSSNRTLPLNAQPAYTISEAPKLPLKAPDVQQRQTLNSPSSAPQNANDNAASPTQAKSTAAAPRHKSAAQARRPLKKPDLTPPPSTASLTPPNTAQPLMACLTGLNQATQLYSAALSTQIQQTRMWANSPVAQFFLQQQLLASQMALAFMPPRGFFQQAAISLANQTATKTEPTA
ncbi:MAG: hypothetical protein AAGG72_00390 [Pseudomonadota bacterium]